MNVLKRFLYASALPALLVATGPPGDAGKTTPVLDMLASQHPHR